MPRDVELSHLELLEGGPNVSGFRRLARFSIDLDGIVLDGAMLCLLPGGRLRVLPPKLKWAMANAFRLTDNALADRIDQMAIDYYRARGGQWAGSVREAQADNA